MKPYACLMIVVAVNPNAKFGRSRTAGALVCDRLTEHGYEVLRLERESWEALLGAATEACADAAALVVVGGDGMAHLAANVAAATGVPFALVPSGTGNDFARELGLISFEQALEALPAALERAPRGIDALRIRMPEGRERHAVGIVSVGFDADVNRRSFELTRIPARLRYNAAILLTLAKPRHRRFTVQIDDEASFELSTLLFAVANHQRFGGGIRVAPTARIDDGLLTIVWAQPLRRVRFYQLLAKALRGRHMGERGVRTADAKRVTLTSPESADAFADGELIGSLPVEVTVRPALLRVHV